VVHQAKEKVAKTLVILFIDTSEKGEQGDKPVGLLKDLEKDDRLYS
jgi:hypothetical protein